MEDLPTQQKKAEASKTIALAGGDGGVISTEKHPQSNAKFKNGFQLLLTTQNKTHNFTTFSDILYYCWIVFCQTLPSSKFSHSSLL